MWEPKTSVNWVTLSPNYGSINTITTELDTVKVTVNTAGMKVGANSGLVYIWDSGSGGSTPDHCPSHRKCDPVGCDPTAASFAASPSR